MSIDGMTCEEFATRLEDIVRVMKIAERLSKYSQLTEAGIGGGLMVEYVEDVEFLLAKMKGETK
jgi:hypothetical protein